MYVSNTSKTWSTHTHFFRKLIIPVAKKFGKDCCASIKYIIIFGSSGQRDVQHATECIAMIEHTNVNQE